MTAQRIQTPEDRNRALDAAGQTTIFDAVILAELDAAAKAGDRDASIRARFLRFHLTNPAVYDELVAMARELRSTGHRRFGIRMLWETLRWRRMIRTTDPSGYKLNDHYPPHYARLIMDREPDLEGIFDVRELRAK